MNIKTMREAESETAAELPPGTIARQIMRRTMRASLATVMPEPDGSPFASLVMVALDHDASPILLLSDLSDHTANIKADPRVSLLFDGTAGEPVPLAGERVSIQGTAEPVDDARLKARFKARHPDAELYLQFSDFRIYRVAIRRAQLIGGYAKAFWLAGDDILFDASGAGDLIDGEAGILEHMAEDHGDAIQLYARHLGGEGGGWSMTGVDPEGADLRKEGTCLRLRFGKPAMTADAVRGELVRAVKRARQAIDDNPQQDEL
jgi:putative heme iron utilization protein